MKTNNRTSQEKFVNDRTIMEAIKEEKGEVPPPLKVMSMQPGTLSTFMAHRNQIMENGPLTDRERALVGIGVAVAMKSGKCVKTQSGYAREAGAGVDDIVQAMLIASLMLGASPLHHAHSGFPNEL